MMQEVLADAEEEAAVVVEEGLGMTSDMHGITFIAEHYFFLKTTPLAQIESKSIRSKQLERKAKTVIMKFSSHDEHLVTNYLPPEHNEVATWINLAILEFNKTQKQKKNQNPQTRQKSKYQVIEP
jgi:hypothetical protein